MTKPVVCVGAAIIDDLYFCLGEPVPGTSNPATHRRSAGGVARNVAHHLAQIGNHVELISLFGNDPDGRWLQDRCTSAGIRIIHSRFTSEGTGHFAGIISPGGELFAGAADTHFEKEITISFLEEKASLLKTASIVLVDCNLSASCLGWLLEFLRTHTVPCVVEPVSAMKASRLAGLNLEDILLITPNNLELAALTGNSGNQNSESLIKDLLKKRVQTIWIRKGNKGSEMFSREEIVSLPAPEVEVVDTTGAGDAALAGWMHAWLKNKSVKECLIYGHAMAEIILQTKGTTAQQLTAEILETNVMNRTTP